MKSEYVEFEIRERERFKKLQNFFEKLKSDKDLNVFESDDFYLTYFDERAKSYFGWYSAEENEEWTQKWFAAPIDKRFSDPTLKRKWNFGSMIDAFKNGEYILLSCEITQETRARLNFSALAFPYGGVECMIALIEAFGFEVIEVDPGYTPPIKWKER